jgi:hypothetical protein
MHTIAFLFIACVKTPTTESFADATVQTPTTQGEQLCQERSCVPPNLAFCDKFIMNVSTGEPKLQLLCYPAYQGVRKPLPELITGVLCGEQLMCFDTNTIDYAAVSFAQVTLDLSSGETTVR